jgi:type I restriction enzyme R subunit
MHNAPSGPYAHNGRMLHRRCRHQYETRGVAAKQAFDAFTQGRNLTAHQLEFVDMMIDHLTARGAMDARLLYESPFTDIDPLGVAGLFKEGEVTELLQILQDVQGRAAA